jgi:hypothetical protein
MPVVVKGINDTKRALRKFDSDLYSEMNKKIATALKEVTNDAKIRVNPYFLTGAMDTGTERQSRTNRQRAFPVYNQNVIRKGLTYSLGRKKSDIAGWTSAYSLLNKSAIGAILEIAGTKNPYGDPESKSNNPDAGRHFIQRANADIGVVKSVGKGRGRIIYAALHRNEGKARAAVMAALEEATRKYKAATKQ